MCMFHFYRIFQLDSLTVRNLSQREHDCILQVPEKMFICITCYSLSATLNSNSIQIKTLNAILVLFVGYSADLVPVLTNYLVI